MSNIIPGTLDHFVVDETHYQQSNDSSISAVSDELKNDVGGPY